MQRFGIDISKWQNGFDFDKAKSEGVEFIILRGAYSNSKDSCFEDFYNKTIDDFIKAADKHCGYYAGECRNLTRDDLLGIANNMKLRSDG